VQAGGGGGQNGLDENRGVKEASRESGKKLCLRLNGLYGRIPRGVGTAQGLICVKGCSGGFKVLCVRGGWEVLSLALVGGDEHFVFQVDY